MQLNKNKIIIIVCALFAFIVLFAFATVYDLQISKAVAALDLGVTFPNKREYLSNSFFGRFFEVAGELPIYFISIFAAGIILVNFMKRRGGFIKWLLIALSAFVMVGMGAYMAYKMVGYITDYSANVAFASNNLLYFSCAVFGAALAFAAYIGISKFSVETLNNLLIWAFIALAAVLLSRVLIEAVKYFNGRARYRTLYVLDDDFSGYTPWYIFNGHRKVSDAEALLGIADDGYKSFPSGHSSSAALLITLTAIPSLLPKLSAKKYSVLFWSVFGAFTILTMAARVVMGAHYATDVLFGAFITVLSYYLVSFVLKWFFGKYINIVPLKNQKNARPNEKAVS